ncbi:stage II sporulation protein P [Lacrimispora saccharolytica]|nr:stage II sporulation protein P [Lacrimispora saccharolytica]
MIKGDGMNDLEKKVRAALILCVIVVGIYLAGKCKEIWERESDGQGGRILGQAYVQAGTLAAGSFLPVLSYGQEQTPEDFFSAVLRTVGEQFPILSFQETDCGEEEIIEDAETAEAIREENEKLIAQKLEAENQAQAVTEENQQAQETQSDGAAETQNETAQAQETSQIPEGTATQKQVEIPREQLTDFNYLLNNFFVVDPTTTALESQINADTLLGKDMKLEKNPEQPQILIYHTHSQEGFADSVEGDTSTTVIGVGDYLVQLLQERYGYQVLHITDTFDIVDGQLDRSAAYNYAEPVISQALQEHPTIEVVIDLHRDGVDESKHLVTEVNGKPTAQVMFFNGLSRTNQNGEISYLPNPYIEDNLAFSFQLEYLAKQYYPEYTRCIYLKGYRYNLHLKPRSLLLEVGAQTNTVEEAKNAMEPFADLLYKVLSGSGTG